MKYMRTRKKFAGGFSLVELLIGVVLFAVLLTLAAMGLSTAHRTLAASKRQLPVEIALQDAMDSATRYIRESPDVAGGGSFVTLNGGANVLSFAKPSLSLISGSSVKALQRDLDFADFRVCQIQACQGNIEPYVVITLTASSPNPNDPHIQKTLVSSVSLRNMGIIAQATTNPTTTTTTTPVSITAPAPAATATVTLAQTVTTSTTVSQGPLIAMAVQQNWRRLNSLGRTDIEINGGFDGTNGDVGINLLTSQGFVSTDSYLPEAGPGAAPPLIFMLPASSAGTPYYQNGRIVGAYVLCSDLLQMTYYTGKAPASYIPCN